MVLKALAACAATLLLAGCATTASGQPTTPTVSVESASAQAAQATHVALDGFLPGERRMAELLGYPVTREVRADLTQLHEGAQVQAADGQVGFYRSGPADSVGPARKLAGSPEAARGGYVALSRFATEADAVRFLATNASFRPDRTADPAEGFRKVFDLRDVADSGSGWVYAEDGESAATGQSTSGIARVGDVVVEVVLFHGPGTDLVDETREAVRELRTRLS